MAGAPGKVLKKTPGTRKMSCKNKKIMQDTGDVGFYIPFCYICHK